MDARRAFDLGFAAAGLELLVMDTELRELVARKGVSAIEIDRMARAHGMVNLFDDAMGKVREGVTSLEEALRTVRVEKS